MKELSNPLGIQLPFLLLLPYHHDQLLLLLLLYLFPHLFQEESQLFHEMVMIAVVVQSHNLEQFLCLEQEVPLLLVQQL